MVEIPEPAGVRRDAVDDRPGHVLGVETRGDQLGAVAPAQPDGAQAVPPPFGVEVDQRVGGRRRSGRRARARRRSAGRRRAGRGAPCTSDRAPRRRPSRRRTASRAGAPPCGRSGARRRRRRGPARRPARTCRRCGSRTRRRRARPPPGAPPRRRCTCRRCCCGGRRPTASRAPAEAARWTTASTFSNAGRIASRSAMSATWLGNSCGVSVRDVSSYRPARCSLTAVPITPSAPVTRTRRAPIASASHVRAWTCGKCRPGLDLARASDDDGVIRDSTVEVAKVDDFLAKRHERGACAS